MKEHAGRIVTALVALPILYAALVWSPPLLFASLIGVVAAFAQTELYTMALPAGEARTWGAGRVPVFAAGVLAGVVLLGLMALAATGSASFPAALTAMVGGIAVVALTCGRDLRVAGPDAAFALFGVWYVAWLLGHTVWLRGLPGGAWLVVFALWVTWIADAAAYYVGKTWGRTALAPRVSPKKTVAGAVGAVAGGAIAALAAAAWFVDALSFGEAAALGAAAAVVGIVGDLFESLIKRGAGVKDSGGLIPSHGGVLDKIDGLLFTAPVIYYYLTWVKGYAPVGAS
ncbi:MAG: phosphatidate cytidylyltransferase [Nitrospirota bacterium]